MLEVNQFKRTAEQWDNLAKLEPDFEKKTLIYAAGLKALPKSAWMHGCAVDFFKKLLNTQDQTDKLYREAHVFAPQDAATLGNDASCFAIIRNDHGRAEEFYKKALVADPNGLIHIGNYASFLLSVNSITEGHAILDLAIAALQSDFAEASLLAEVWMYAVCHWLPERWTIALATLKKVVTMDKVNTGNWDFSGVIAAAIKRDHPAAVWLEPLARVCAGTAPSETLTSWDTWTAAKVS